MSKTVSAYLGLEYPVPGSNEPFSITMVNQNFDKLEDETERLNGILSALGYANVSDLAALADIATPVNGQLKTVTEGGALFKRIAGVWRQLTTASFATIADRNAAYDKAGGAFKVFGAPVAVADVPYVYGLTGWRRRGDGFVPIVLQQADLTGTNATVDKWGVITLAATPAAGVNLKNWFTAEFEKYRMVWDFYGVANSSPLYMRMSAAGTPETGSNYSTAGVTNNAGSTTVSAWSSTAQPFWDIGRAGPDILNTGEGEVDFAFPADATRRTRILHRQLATDGINNIKIDAGGTHNVAASYDGIQLYSSGVMNARLQIFGLAK